MAKKKAKKKVAKKKAKKKFKATQKKDTVHCDHWDIQEFVKKTFGKTIDIQDMLFCSNDSVHTFTLSKSKRGNEDEEHKDAEDYLFGRKDEMEHHSIHALLDVLCNHSYMDEGWYEVRVSW
jgi:hypothetical protein